MPNKIGIFIDVNSIGWTLINQETKGIVAMGTHVFSPGSENFGMGRREISKKFNKRIFRLRRVRYARIRVRKIHLLKILIENKMCPLSLEELNSWSANKVVPETNFDEWMRLDPYELRSKAIYGQISLHELGRILYQISSHRGYRFGERNSKLVESVLKEGSPEEGKVGFAEMRRVTRDETLGSYLYSIKPIEGKSYTKSNARIRNRVCTIQMYFNEIHAIWNVQQQFFHNLTEDLRNTLIGSPGDVDPSGVLFFQRALKSQKHKVGNCMFEPNKTRACISSFEYQEVEAYKFINSIEFSGHPLNANQRSEVLGYFFTHYRFKFIDIKRLLNLEYSQEFNYKDEEGFKGSFIHSELSKSKFFGKGWFQIEEKVRQDIWHALYFFSSSHRLHGYASEKLGFSDHSSFSFSKIRMDKNYAPISKRACNNILFFLRLGITYNLSVILGGVKNALRNVWDQLSEDEINEIMFIVEDTHLQSPSSLFVDNLKENLDKLGYDSIDESKLYGGAAKKNSSKTILNKLPIDPASNKQIFELKNTILIQSVFELRKLINKIIEVHGPIHEISCELSVDVKVSRMQRFLHRMDQRRTRNNRERYIRVLGLHKENIIPMNLLKYELWEECKGVCPYTGIEIPLDKLWTDEIRISYINPWSHSLNDSVFNKTLCFSFFHDLLNERNPFDYFNEEDPDAWESIKKRTAKLFASSNNHPASYSKFKRFIKKYNQRNLSVSQFNDSNYLSRAVHSYLSQLSKNVNVSPGNTTSHLIEEWLLTSLIDKEKINSDLRYSALKGYVNAFKTDEHILELSKRNKYFRNTKKNKFPTPAPDHLTHLDYHINSILVSHKKDPRVISKKTHVVVHNGVKVLNKGWSVRGMLHKETLFGKRTAPRMNSGLHVRKSLLSFKTLNQVDKIVDPIIREIVKAAVKKTTTGNSQIPFSTFFKTAPNGSLIPKLYLPNTKGGDPVPIKKVRIREVYTTDVNIKKGQNQHVIPRNNHHVLVYKDKDEVFCEQVITFWQAIKRKKAGEAVVQLPNPEEDTFVTTLRINDMFLMGTENLEDDLNLESRSYLKNHLYRIQKSSSKFYEFRLAYKQASPRTNAPEYIRVNNFGERKTGWNTYNPVKVEVDVIGQIKRKIEKI